MKRRAAIVSPTPVVPSLLDFVPLASPRFVRPDHLAPVAELLERAEREPVRAVVSVSVRHGKTELLKHAIVRRLLRDPTRRVIYGSYAQRPGEKRSREMRALYKRVGGKVADDAASRSDWRTGEDEDGIGGVWVTSTDGSVTGEGGDLIIVDDPHKGRAPAESPIEREKVRTWFFDDLFTRAEPDASIIVVQSRWHQEDLAGHLIGLGWEHVTLPALDDEGRALWPERYTAERLREIEEQIGSYSFEGLYLQRPPARGGSLFLDARFYDELPKTFRPGKGLDLAYTSKTRADRSAGVVLLEEGGLYYVADVRTAQVRVPDFLAVLKGVDATYPGPWHWYTSTTEAGLADLATETAGVRIVATRAAADKFVRAQPVAAAWNAGKILLPRKAPWLDDFLAEVLGFVGAGDRHDDRVDALAAAFDSISTTRYEQLPPPGLEPRVPSTSPETAATGGCSARAFFNGGGSARQFFNGGGDGVVDLPDLAALLARGGK